MKVCSYFGNPWIGMFAKTNNAVTILPLDASEKFVRAVEESLKTKTIKTSVGDSNLLGIYTVMNSNGIILPNITTQEEFTKIKQSGLNVYLSQDIHNAHGNNILANDRGGLVNERVSKEEKRKIEEALGVELIPAKIANYLTVGSACLANNRGFLAHYNASEEEMGRLKDVLKIVGKKGSVNFGAGFISLGALANDRSYIAGEKTSAFEMGKLEESLDFNR